MLARGPSSRHGCFSWLLVAVGLEWTSSGARGVLGDDERTQAGVCWRLKRADRVDEEVLAQGAGIYTVMGDNKEMTEVIRRAIEGWRNFYSSELEESKARSIVAAHWGSFKNKQKGSNVALAQAIEAVARAEGKEVRAGHQPRRQRAKSPAANPRLVSTPPRGGAEGSEKEDDGEGGGGDWDVAGPRARGSAAAKRAASAKRSPPSGGGAPRRARESVRGTSKSCARPFTPSLWHRPRTSRMVATV